jgi:sodium-dependent dicarboxylate transporter 2/3/5
VLFGGGIALARGFEVSGLSEVLGRALSGFAAWPLLLMLLAVTLSVAFMSELVSNTAMAALLMPILAAAAKGAALRPELLMLPGVLGASCGFMLPVATAPNAIVYGTQRVASSRMARAGFALNLIGGAVITLVCALAL